MNWKLVPLDALPPQPWRNGGGVTRELLAWPDAADWRVRVSVADVHAAGPFSRFAGVERWFAVLAGQGVVLRVAGEAHRLTAASEPFRFDGGTPVDCILVAGATRDFNLMAPPGRASLGRVRGRVGVHTDGQRLLALYAHDLPATLSGDAAQLEVPPYHLAWRCADAPLSATIEAADALWMEVMP